MVALETSIRPDEGSASGPTVVVTALDAPAGRRAVARAAELFGVGSRLLVVSVAASERGVGAAAELVEQIAASSAVPVEQAVTIGDPARTIAEWTRRTDAVVVVVGLGSDGRASRALATSIVSRADCPVCLIA